jgi:hypothetical protein
MWVAKPEGKSHSEDLVVGGRIIVKYVKEIRWGSVDWSNLARKMCKRQAVTILVNKLPYSTKYGNFLTN